MKNTNKIAVITVGIAILVAGCEGLLGDLLKFDSDHYGVEFTIESTDSVGTHVFKEEAVESGLEALLQENGIDPGNLDYAKIKEGKATILTPDENFDAIGAFSIVVYTPSLGETTVAWLDEVPLGVSEIQLDFTDIDLKNYLNDTVFTIKAVGTVREVVESPVEVLAEIQFELKGQLLKK